MFLDFFFFNILNDKYSEGGFGKADHSGAAQ